MRRVWLAVAALTFAGCAEYTAGDTYAVGYIARLYLDEKMFRDAVQLDMAGTTLAVDDFMKAHKEGRMASLDEGDRVRVVEAVDGGAKVAVLSGKLQGALGWMIRRDLPASRKK